MLAPPLALTLAPPPPVPVGPGWTWPWSPLGPLQDERRGPQLPPQPDPTFPACALDRVPWGTPRPALWPRGALASVTLSEQRGPDSNLRETEAGERAQGRRTRPQEPLFRRGRGAGGSWGQRGLGGGGSGQAVTLGLHPIPSSQPRPPQPSLSSQLCRPRWPSQDRHRGEVTQPRAWAWSGGLGEGLGGLGGRVWEGLPSFLAGPSPATAGWPLGGSRGPGSLCHSELAEPRALPVGLRPPWMTRRVCRGRGGQAAALCGHSSCHSGAGTQPCLSPQPSSQGAVTATSAPLHGTTPSKPHVWPPPAQAQAQSAGHSSARSSSSNRSASAQL